MAAPAQPAGSSGRGRRAPRRPGSPGRRSGRAPSRRRRSQSPPPLPPARRCPSTSRRCGCPSGAGAVRVARLGAALAWLWAWPCSGCGPGRPAAAPSVARVPPRYHARRATSPPCPFLSARRTTAHASWCRAPAGLVRRAVTAGWVSPLRAIDSSLVSAAAGRPAPPPQPRPPACRPAEQPDLHFHRPGPGCGACRYRRQGRQLPRHLLGDHRRRPQGAAHAACCGCWGRPAVCQKQTAAVGAGPACCCHQGAFCLIHLPVVMMGPAVCCRSTTRMWPA